VNTTDCISSVQPQTFFFVILFEWKSLAVVREQRILLIVFRRIGNLLQLCLSNLKSLGSFSSEHFIIRYYILVNSPWKCKGDWTTSDLWKEPV